MPNCRWEVECSVSTGSRLQGSTTTYCDSFFTACPCVTMSLFLPARGVAILKSEYSSVVLRYLPNKKHLKNVGPIRHCEPPHALILHCHSAGVATVARLIVARRLRIDVHDDDNNDNA